MYGFCVGTIFVPVPNRIDPYLYDEFCQNIDNNRVEFLLRTGRIQKAEEYTRENWNLLKLKEN